MLASTSGFVATVQHGAPSFGKVTSACWGPKHLDSGAHTWSLVARGGAWAVLSVTCRFTLMSLSQLTGNVSVFSRLWCGFCWFNLVRLQILCHLPSLTVVYLCHAACHRARAGARLSGSALMFLCTPTAHGSLLVLPYLGLCHLLSSCSLLGPKDQNP